MPYTTNADLPDAVRKLPAHQQDIFLAAFNAAFDEYGGDEEKAFATAWAAVNKQKGKGAAMSDEFAMSHDPAVYWNAEEVSTITSLEAAELRKDNGKPYSWHPLVPVGEFVHPKFGKLAFSSEDVAEFAAHFKAGVRGADIPVDEIGAHETTPGGAAYGWLEEVEIRPDALYGKIGWNKQGQDALADDEYRYISPTLHTRDLPFTAKDGSKVGNVVKSICLTNRPVFKGQPALTVNMAEYTTGEDETETVATDGRSDGMVTDGVKELEAEQAAQAAEPAPEPEAEVEGAAAEHAEPEADQAALLQERDDLLAQVERLTDRVAELEQATVAAAEPQAAPAAVETAEAPTPEAVKLAEVERELLTLRDERALELAEKQYREIELEGHKRLGKADVELYAKVHRALPVELAAQFAEHVSGGGPTFVQFGEVGLAATADRKPTAEKLYEKVVKDKPDEALPDQTRDALLKFAEGKDFGDFDEMYAAFAEAGKPGVK